MNETSPSARVLAYRPEIDGLRAIAVTIVLLFHAGLSQLDGGYVGVDVFFLISGYLITSLVRREIVQEQFSFKRFYLRRIRRLSPALLLVLVLTLPAAWWLLYPEDLVSYASSLVVQPFSLQNVFLLVDGQYFRGSDTKPLLHTWSLAVEEQFYLLWPLLLVWLSRLSFKRGVLLLGAGFVASFALNIVLMPVSPKASFFLLPPRAWELGAGALVALFEERGAFSSLGTRGRTALSATGLGMIAASAVGIFPQTSFPGWVVLLPAAGAAACLIATCGPHHLTRVLSNRFVVHVGLISYPLYLWHWPLLVLWRYGHPQRHGVLDSLCVLAVSVVLADLTYRVVEKPVRERQWLSTGSSLVRLAVAGGLLSIAAGVHMRETEGAAYRYSGIARALVTAPFRSQSDRCGAVFRTLHPVGQVCPLTEETQGRQVLIWGNSHADMWTGMLRDLAREKGATLFLSARNCRATVDNAFCGRHVQRGVLDFITSHKITDVALISSWYGSYKIPDETFEAELEKVVTQLNQLNVRLWLVVDAPSSFDLGPLNAFKKNPSNPRFGTVPASEQVARRLRERALFTRLTANNPKAHVVDPSESLCDSQECPGGKGETAWYRDADHVSDAGAFKTKAHFAPMFSD